MEETIPSIPSRATPASAAAFLTAMQASWNSDSLAPPLSVVHQWSMFMPICVDERAYWSTFTLTSAGLPEPCAAA